LPQIPIAPSLLLDSFAPLLLLVLPSLELSPPLVLLSALPVEVSASELEQPSLQVVSSPSVLLVSLAVSVVLGPPLELEPPPSDDDAPDAVTASSELGQPAITTKANSPRFMTPRMPGCAAARIAQTHEKRMDPRIQRLFDDDPDVRVLVVVAHPDDETLGAGALLQRLRTACIVHVTDGAPRDPALWNAPAESRDAYAATRRVELTRALAIASEHPPLLRTLGAIDQEADLRIAALAPALATMLGELRPDVVLTHPYEGGHPDHDAAAAIVQAAIALVDGAPALVEMAFYHAAGGTSHFGTFVPDATRPEHAVTLAPDVRARKQRMLACFETQRDVLDTFPTDVERYREGKLHDFSRPPHDGELHYERKGWSDGASWRARVCRAADELGLSAKMYRP
jgi:LmbE family N-acetylglucosaminyl deacetylase